MSKFFFLAILMVGLVSLLSPLTLVRSAGADEEIAKQLQAAGQGGNLQYTDPRLTIILIIRIILGLIGLILVGFIIYAGFLWMTAGGNEEAITKAKATLRNSVIGLIIILSAYSITIFVANLALGYGGGYYSGFNLSIPTPPGAPSVNIGVH